MMVVGMIVLVLALLIAAMCVCYNCAGCYWHARRMEAERRELEEQARIELQLCAPSMMVVELNRMAGGTRGRDQPPVYDTSRVCSVPPMYSPTDPSPRTGAPNQAPKPAPDVSMDLTEIGKDHQEESALSDDSEGFSESVDASSSVCTPREDPAVVSV